MTKLEDFLETIPSKQTRKSYKNGIKKLEEYSGCSITKLIRDPQAAKKIEKFYIWLKENNYSQNSCRNIVNGGVQFLKYFDTDIKLRKSIGIYRSEICLTDHLLTIDEVQRMAEVADIREQIILEFLLLGLRVSDAARLEKELFDISKETPIPLMIYAKKEGTIYRTFISEEFKELLKLYLPKVECKWLLDGKRKDQHISNDALNWTIQELAKRANLKINGNLRWHCGRKLVLRTAAELGINQWSAKALTGKSIPKDVATYIEGLSLKKDFLKLHNVLRLKREQKQTNGTLKEAVDLMMRALRKLLENELEQTYGSGTGKELGLIIDFSEMSDEELIKWYLGER